MHENNMDLLVLEATRVLRQQAQLLKNMKDAPNVVAEGDSQEEQTFTQEQMPKDIEVLQGELNKLEGGLQMVLAVVGTMKAGKSTAINAIVGTEVLPSRNRPMTALPTLIRHKVGVAEPVLHFKNNKPLKDLVGRLQRNPLVRDQADDEELGELVSSISSGLPIRSRYEGVDAICGFLRTLNDLVRLCREVEDKFPFDDYDEVHEFPVIDVEFVHLKEVEESHGQLVLLDTPGPNESGQQRLKEVLHDQLRKASAVLLVLDYTQLKSDADEEVRGELKEIARMTGDRVYVMVNKFDQKDRNSDDVDAVKRIVVNDLMSLKGDDGDRVGGGMVSEDHVFPVSALQAFLANRATHEVGRSGRLPDPAVQPWVEDFAEEALGRLWESQVEDPEVVVKGAAELWKDSLFDEPLNLVIRAAHSQAAKLALQSAIDKVVAYSDKVSNFTSARTSALDKKLDDLNRHIEELEGDKRKLESMREEARTRLDKSVKDVMSELEKVKKNLQNQASTALKAFFADGRVLERRERKEEDRAKKREAARGVARLVRKLTGFKRSDDREPLWKPNEGRIELSNRDKAKALIGEIDDSVRSVMTTFNEELGKAIGDAMKDFDESMTGIKDGLDETLRTVGSRMEEQGFEFKVRTPKMRTVGLPAMAREIFDGMLDVEKYSVTRTRHKDSIWGDVCKWWGTSDWGTEEYNVKKKRYVIDIHEAKNAVLAGLGGSLKQLSTHIEEQVKSPMRNASDELFRDAKRSIERIRGDLIRGRKDRQLDAKKQTELVRKLNAFSKRGQGIAGDGEGLRSDIDGTA